MGNTLIYILIGGYVALLLGFGIWAIVRAKREYREHKKFIKSIKVGDFVMYRGFEFEIVDRNNHSSAIKIKTDGWLYEDDFGYLRPAK